MVGRQIVDSRIFFEQTIIKYGAQEIMNLAPDNSTDKFLSKINY